MPKKLAASNLIDEEIKKMAIIFGDSLTRVIDDLLIGTADIDLIQGRTGIDPLEGGRGNDAILLVAIPS